MKICESAKLSTFFPFSYAWRHTIRDLLSTGPFRQATCRSNDHDEAPEVGIV